MFYHVPSVYHIHMNLYWSVLMKFSNWFELAQACGLPLRRASSTVLSRDLTIRCPSRSQYMSQHVKTWNAKQKETTYCTYGIFGDRVPLLIPLSTLGLSWFWWFWISLEHRNIDSDSADRSLYQINASAMSSRSCSMTSQLDNAFRIPTWQGWKPLEIQNSSNMVMIGHDCTAAATNASFECRWISMHHSSSMNISDELWWIQMNHCCILLHSTKKPPAWSPE